MSESFENSPSVQVRYPRLSALIDIGLPTRLMCAGSVAFSAIALVSHEQSWPVPVILLLIFVSVISQRRHSAHFFDFIAEGVMSLLAVASAAYAATIIPATVVDAASWYVNSAIWLAVMTCGSSFLRMIGIPSLQRLTLVLTLSIVGVVTDIVSLQKRAIGNVANQRLSTAQDDSKGDVWFGYFQSPLSGGMRHKKFGDESLLITLPHTFFVDHYPNNPRDYFWQSSQCQLDFEKSWYLFSDPPTGSIELKSTVDVTNFVARPDEPFRLQLTSRCSYSGRKGDKFGLTLNARAKTPGKIRVRIMERVTGKGHVSIDEKEVEINQQWNRKKIEIDIPRDLDRFDVAIDLAAQQTVYQFSELVVQTVRPTITPDNAGFITPSSVHLEYNSHGFRDRERDIAPAPKVFRIACLGDSFTEGVGVHEFDRLSDHLERMLNQHSWGGSQTSDSIEVLNFGLGGYGTRDERALYQYVVRNYKPQLVLLFMVANDAVWVDESMRPAGDKLTQTIYKTEEERAKAWEREQPKQDYARCIPELNRLKQLCAEDGAKLVVFSFRIFESDDWISMTRLASSELRGMGVPFCDLGVSLLSSFNYRELTVHPIDGHPNEIAHRLAAKEVKRFLLDKNLISSRP